MSYFHTRFLILAVVACSVLVACVDNNDWDVVVEKGSGSKCLPPPSTTGHITVGPNASGATVMSFINPRWWTVEIQSDGRSTGRPQADGPFGMAWSSFDVDVPSGKGPREITVIDRRRSCLYAIRPK